MARGAHSARHAGRSDRSRPPAVRLTLPDGAAACAEGARVRTGLSGVPLSSVGKQLLVSFPLWPAERARRGMRAAPIDAGYPSFASVSPGWSAACTTGAHVWTERCSSFAGRPAVPRTFPLWPAERDQRGMQAALLVAGRPPFASVSPVWSGCKCRRRVRPVRSEKCSSFVGRPGAPRTFSFMARETRQARAPRRWLPSGSAGLVARFGSSPIRFTVPGIHTKKLPGRLPAVAALSSNGST